MADPNRSRVKEEILHVLKNSDDLLRAFRSKIEDKYVIIFVGNTRNGKSTLVNYIMETPLVAFQEGSLFRIELQNGASAGPAIGHGTLSHTTVPMIVQLSERPDTVIVDAPGFDDNRGPIQEIINSLYINQIKYSKGVGFVLVSDINSIINDNINYFLSFIETIHTIMPDFVKLKEAVSIIFTKDCKNYDLVDIVKLLRAKVLDVEGLHCKKDLIRHFVEREDLIGLFRMPTVAGLLTEEVEVNVRAAIFGSLPINLNQTDIKFGISKNARVILLDTYLEFFDVVISLKETFKGFRTSVFGKFDTLSKEKLLSLTGQQLSGEGSLQQIIEQFCSDIRNSKEQCFSTAQIADFLQQLYIEDVNSAIASVENIGIQMPKETNPRSITNTIEEVRKKLEYISCIEKVVERNDKSRDVLANYHENTGLLYKQMKGLYENVTEEIEIRNLLTFRLNSIPDIKNRLQEVDEPYLSASMNSELINMKDQLEFYIQATDQILDEISRRPALQRCSLQGIYATSTINSNIGNKIRVIEKHIENRNKEVLLKDIPQSVTGVIGTLLFYTGISYWKTLSKPTQLKVAAGSFLLLAALSWKSTYMRTMFWRLRRRYHQNRLFSKRTKLDGCWRVLVGSEARYRYFRR